ARRAWTLARRRGDRQRRGRARQHARAAVPEGARRGRAEGDRRRGDRQHGDPRRRERLIDSHTHLELCEPSDAELVEAASAVGVTRMLTVGIDGASCRAALAAAEAFPQVYAAVGRHPNAATGFDDADLAALAALAVHPRCVAVGETGLGVYLGGAA